MEAERERPRVLVFGGSGTLGRAVVAALAARGARVALTYHQGEAVARGLAARFDGVVTRRLDLTATADIPGAIDELAAALGGVDAFVHCAALGSTASPPAYDLLGGTAEAGWDRLMSVNVKSAFFACQRLGAVMADGNLVLLGSINGVKSVPAPVPYSAATGALRAMVIALAKELGPRAIRVNLIAPGVLEKGVSSVLPDDLRKQYLKHSAMKRLGRVEEAALLVVFFAIDNTYVTGQTVLLDGGL